MAKYKSISDSKVSQIPSIVSTEDILLISGKTILAQNFWAYTNCLGIQGKTFGECASVIDFELERNGNLGKEHIISVQEKF